MRRLASLSLAGFVSAVVGCGGANGPEPLAADFQDAPTAPAAAASKVKSRPGVRGGPRRSTGPLSRPSSD